MIHRNISIDYFNTNIKTITLLPMFRTHQHWFNKTKQYRFNIQDIDDWPTNVYYSRPTWNISSIPWSGIIPSLSLWLFSIQFFPLNWIYFWSIVPYYIYIMFWIAWGTLHTLAYITCCIGTQYTLFLCVYV